MLDIIKRELLKIIDNIDSGNSQLSESECEEVLKHLQQITIPETKYSKYQACKYLRISRATFDNWVRSGKLPKGQKQQGFKELFWTLSDLKNIKYDKS